MYKTRKKTCQTKKTEVGAIFTTQLWLNTWIFEIKMFLYIKQCKKNLDTYIFFMTISWEIFAKGEEVQNVWGNGYKMKMIKL